jgi:hypothetical protein
MLPKLSIIIVLVLLLICAPASQGAPLGTAFTYQGLLKNGGSPVNAAADFEFSLWDSPDADCEAPDGTQIGATQTILDVNIADGLFTVALNGAGEFGASAFDGSARWLQIAVRSPAGTGAFTTLCPRQQLDAAPYALQTRGLLVDGEGLHVTGNVLAGDHVVGFDDPGGASPDSYTVIGSDDLAQSVGVIMAVMDGVQGSRVWMTLDAAARRLDLTHGWTTGGDLDYYFSRNKLAILQGGTDGARVMTIGGVGDNVGIGTANPLARLDVAGSVRMTGFELPAGASNGRVLKSDANGVGTWQSDGLTLPFTGSANAAGAAALDITNTDSFGLYGIRASVVNGNGYGVYGLSGGNIGVFGHATDTTGTNYGVRGESESTTGRGVIGLADASTGANYGGWFETDSNEGVGVYGFADSASGDTYGVYGEADSTSGIGVYGVADASSGGTVGVFGKSTSATGVGIYGENTDNVGIWGRATGNSGVNYGVYGQTSSPDGFGVYCIGRMHVNGTLSKNAGSFKIDHPLDPANKYLSHSFVESPDMMNIYNGNVVTDGRGYATVTLPEWFEALNRDFRYQLTPIGQFAQAIVAEEIKDNRLVIRTDRPGVKVSWQVTGIRRDAYADAHRIPVEEEKLAEERGKYQHPELYHQPHEKGIDFRPSVERHASMQPEISK